MLAWEFSGSLTDGLGRLAHNRSSAPRCAKGGRSRGGLRARSGERRMRADMTPAVFRQDAGKEKGRRRGKMTTTTVVMLLLMGCGGGFLAGLLGVGGGMVLVPFLVMIFDHVGHDPAMVVQTALATALATIMFTSLSSMRAHHRKGAVQWN